MAKKMLLFGVIFLLVLMFVLAGCKKTGEAAVSKGTQFDNTFSSESYKKIYQEKISKLPKEDIKELAKARKDIIEQKRLIKQYENQKIEITSAQKAALESAQQKFKSLLEKYEIPEEIDQEVDEINENSETWNANYNSIMLMPDEMKKQHLGSNDEEAKPKETKVYSSTSSSPPDSFDWRNYNGKNYVTSVKDQGSCGSCWAFATVGAVEAAARIYDDNPALNIDLSEQDLVSCSGAGNCVDGGYASESLEYIEDDGSKTESCFPYTATDQSCSNSCINLENGVSGISYSSVSLSNTEAIKQALTEKGPLVTGMYIYYDFYFYSDGIYKYTSGDYEGNHVVVIVGYGTSNGKTYWIAKNSWGTYWGEDGFFRIYAGEAGIDSRFIYAITSVGLSQCTNQCTSGTKQCYGTTGYQTCGDYDSNSCYEWSSVTNCASGYTCSNGACVASCTNECTTSGAKQCSGSGYQTCGNYDSDSCLEWGSVINTPICASGYTCSNGICVSICSSNYVFNYLNGRQDTNYYSVAWSDRSDITACCSSTAECVGLDGKCYSNHQSSPGFNSGGNDNIADCEWVTNWWFDCDYDGTSCKDCKLKWVKSGEKKVFGEYDTATSTECCGDDANEYYVTANCPGVSGKSACCDSPKDLVNSRGECTSTLAKCCEGNANKYLNYVNGRQTGNSYDVAWSDKSDITACCSSASECVGLDGKCYSNHQSLSGFNPGGNDNIADCEWVTNWWFDCDYDGTACKDCKLRWVKGGETAAFGEYSTGAATECCGDDANEYYVTGDCTNSGKTACCNSANDKINAQGKCVSRC
ncbi:MAG: C1 family peptidase [Candidatus Woesearchaeota archaeon]|nr:C1 family peptidase [Candidatus Woesearchaeota archaeon]